MFELQQPDAIRIAGRASLRPGAGVEDARARARSATLTILASTMLSLFSGVALGANPSYPEFFRPGSPGGNIIGQPLFPEPLCTDADNDSFSVEGFSCGPVDCDDTDPDVFPGAPERCNDGDNQCPGDPGHGLTDETCLTHDPASPQWLKYNDQADSPFFLCGAGDPEGFLYLDETRQNEIIDKMIGTGTNGIYLMAVRGGGGGACRRTAWGGDGCNDENPFIDNNDPTSGLDQAVLDSWEVLFDRMDDNGIVIFFIFYDDSSDPFNGSSMGADEQTFIRDITNEFKHHNNLIWVVAEEYSETISQNRVSQIAAEIRANDPVHPISNHQLTGLSFDHADDPNLDQFAIQAIGDANSFHSDMIQAWNNAAGRYNLNLAEGKDVNGNFPYATGADARRIHWAVAMGGAYVMVIGWFTNHEPTHLELMDCGRVASFMQSVDRLAAMAPHDELTHGGTDWVLANPGDSYIAYSEALSGNIGLKGMTAGDYDFRWFDTVTGNVVEETMSVPPGNNTWPTPPGIGIELAVYIARNNSFCGNGVREPGEECDGSDLGGVTCQDRGYSGGTLACAGSCTYDESGCS